MLLRTTRNGYAGSVIVGCRSQLRTVFGGRPVCRAISRTDGPSGKCNRLIFANMPTVITPFTLRNNYAGRVVHVGPV